MQGLQAKQRALEDKVARKESALLEDQWRLFTTMGETLHTLNQVRVSPCCCAVLCCCCHGGWDGGITLCSRLTDGPCPLEYGADAP